jgi:hypothetical protein
MMMVLVGGSKPGLLLLIVADLSSRYIGLAKCHLLFAKLAKIILCSNPREIPFSPFYGFT